jgi:hypothetical protein
LSKSKAPPVALYPAVFLTSASVLMLQVALTRLFSFTLWYYFAYVVISLALLGYGASGALLSAFPGILRGNLPRTLFGCTVAAAAFIPMSLLIYAHTPFYPLQLLQDKAQWGYLAAYYAAAGIPFFLAGVCISGAIAAASERVTRVYCADLIGAGLGAGLVVPLIWRFETPGVVILAAGLMAGAAACWGLCWRPRAAVAPLALIIMLAAGGGPFWRSLEFRPTMGKMMAFLTALNSRPMRQSAARDSRRPVRLAAATASSASTTRGCRRLTRYSRWGAIFRVDVLEPLDDAMRTRGYYRCGASVKYRGPALDWLSIPHDGDANATIFRNGGSHRLAAFDDHVLALPYRVLRPSAKVLILGAGGGTEVICALQHGASEVTAIELDPITVGLIKGPLARFAGGIGQHPGVRYLVGEGRSFVRRYDRTYDLIQINSVDSQTATSAGVNVLNENYLYTVEGCKEHLSHLATDGVFCLSHMGSTAGTGPFKFRVSMLRAGAILAALEQRGVTNPENHIAIIGGRGLMSYLVRVHPFAERDVRSLERYCVENGFWVYHLPYRDQNNELSSFLEASPETRADYVRRSPLRRDPPTDDRPFAWPYFKWRYVFHPAHRYDRFAMPSGQFVMLPLLGVAVVGSLAFILGPLVLFRRRGVYSRAAPGLAVYFAALGFGFMFVEISFIQRFVLFLGYPTYSLTVVLSALLVSSGIGSLASQRLISRAERSLVWSLVGLLLVAALYLVFGGAVFDAFLGYALWARILVAIALIAPLGFAMGTFFPTGIRVVNEVAPQFVPWAWGINACTSVVAAILAVMLAMSVGFRMVGICALAIYVVGVMGLYAARHQSRSQIRGPDVSEGPIAAAQE